MVQTPHLQMGKLQFDCPCHADSIAGIKQSERTSHTVYSPRYHLVWIAKYRYRVLTAAMKQRVRDIIAQVAAELGVSGENGVVSSDPIHRLVSIPPHVAVADFVKIAKGRSSRKIQEEFPELRKRYWGRHCWARGSFSATSGNVTDDIINELSTGIATLTNHKMSTGSGSNALQLESAGC